MMEELHHYRRLRLTLEAQSAHAIHSGKGSLTHDVLVVRDGNGLPTIPGSSLAGVLRHRFAAIHGEDASNRLFGNQIGMSRLQVGWGLVHDSRNQPVEGLRENLQRDSILALLLEDTPLVRQRVRLNHLGSAADTGKFDVTLIPAGVRYTSWIGCWGDGSEEAAADWQALLDILQDGSLRLGHGTRTGAGQFRPVQLHEGHWDLRNTDQAGAYSARSRSRADTRGLKERVLQESTARNGITFTMQLKAESGWRIGGGESVLDGANKHEKDPDLLPMHERRICWEGNSARLDAPRYLLPASAIKGALRHRVAYHYRCIKGQFAGTLDSPDAENCEAVRQLFGYAERDQAQAGLLFIDDIHIQAAKTGVLMHNRIDRFTGGVQRGALFSEQVLWGTGITVRMHIPDDPRRDHIEPEARQALRLTLEDLARGWLPLGAAGSRGLGSFISEDGSQWSDKGAWINASQEASA